jgi:hypothetical protein
MPKLTPSTVPGCEAPHLWLSEVGESFEDAIMDEDRFRVVPVGGLSTNCVGFTYYARRNHLLLGGLPAHSPQFQAQNRRHPAPIAYSEVARQFGTLSPPNWVELFPDVAEVNPPAFAYRPAVIRSPQRSRAAKSIGCSVNAILSPSRWGQIGVTLTCSSAVRPPRS